MFKDLSVFHMAHAMAKHASVRQSVVAQNVANADTPGYRSRDIASFTDIYRPSDDGQGMQRSRQGHLGPEMRDRQPTAHIAEDQGAMSPNGNSVSLEAEMLRSIDVKRQHDRALAIYKSSLDVLRASIGRR
jgi:flagellar basal-body rod protein FlgB